jgi:hypothetical protein
VRVGVGVGMKGRVLGRAPGIDLISTAVIAIS